MTQSKFLSCPRSLLPITALACAGLVSGACLGARAQNFLRNPGFEEAGSGPGTLPAWTTAPESAAQATLVEREAHSGTKAIAIPANSSVEQKVDSLAAGAYLARGWVKSEADQSVTFMMRNPDQPWAAYTCAELKVPRDQWTRVEVFCPLDQKGPLTLTLGGVTKEFHMYHGTGLDMSAPILADDFELVRYEPKLDRGLAVWDAGRNPDVSSDWPARPGWRRVENPGKAVAGTAVFQAGPILGVVRQSDGGLDVYSVQTGHAKLRCSVVPSPALTAARCTMLQDNGRVGLRLSSSAEDRSYTAWLTEDGLVQVEASHIPEIQLRQCQLRYGLLPSFVGTDLSYTPAEVARSKTFSLPSTQWFVGLVDGNDSMLVAAWQTNTQPVSLEAAGVVGNQLIQTVTIGTQTGGFSFSLVEHPNLWHREPLNEDWLADYVPISWERPFSARWMGRFFVTSGGMSSFRDPGIGYSFPVAAAKTRMWGLWFEDWNHYPFYFDGDKTVVHFDKTFIPRGEALFYFLEPAAADLLSPCEIVERALGEERALALFDLGGNGLRKLKYSTPDRFMFDRPVCATTTRLSKIKQEEKATVGVELATHLYEFICGIRARVDQYAAYFTGLKDYLETQKKEHPDLQEYADELEAMVTKAQSQEQEIYATPLAAVQAKTEQMKAQLREGKGDGFNCGDLDVRSPAGAQDDLCRRYNRWVMKLTQTAAEKCGDSGEKAAIATYIWNQSRQILRQPTRWEPRRTLYFFEP